MKDENPNCKRRIISFRDYQDAISTMMQISCPECDSYLSDFLFFEVLPKENTLCVNLQCKKCGVIHQVDFPAILSLSIEDTK